MSDFILFYLRGRDLVKQLLYESEWAYPAADGSSEHESPQHDKSEDIEACAVSG